MTYLDYINQFWALKRQEIITSNQIALYFAILNEFNQRGWPEEAAISNVSLRGAVSMSEPTLINCRLKLKKLGLIDFNAGNRNRCYPNYYLKILSNIFSKNEITPYISNTINSITIKDKDKEEESKDSLSKKIFDAYNEICKNLRPVKILTEKRKKMISARAREHGEEKIMQMLNNAANSNFLAGQNSKGWQADFDWLFRPENFVKTLEGKYNNSAAHGKQSNFDYLSTAFERLTQQQ